MASEPRRSPSASVGKHELLSHEKARREQAWIPRPPEETLIDMGYSAIELGLAPDKIGREARERRTARLRPAHSRESETESAHASFQ